MRAYTNLIVVSALGIVLAANTQRACGDELGFSYRCLLEQNTRCSMPYLSNANLPISVRNNLPSGAQDIYRAAFNNAYENHAHNPIEESDAHNIAWAAVKRAYVKEGEEWIPRGVPG